MKDLVQEGRQLQNRMQAKLTEAPVPPNIEQLMDEFGELSDQIDQINNQLKKLKTRFEDLDETLVPIMEQLQALGQNSVTTKKYLITIKRMGYDRVNKSYKDGFELSLKKVNAIIRNILEETLKATETTTHVAASLGVQKLAATEALQETDGMLKNIIAKMKAFVQRILMKIRAANVEMKTVDNIAKKIIVSK